MLKKCDLRFVENAILTKEMLNQINDEPKWLALDSVSFITTGIISGFEFVDNGMDEQTKLTKGNIIVDGIWYRLEEDYYFDNSDLEMGAQYDVRLVEHDGQYEIDTLKSSNDSDGIVLASFKYEYDNHKRTFRVPNSISDWQKEEAYIKNVNIPYYNYYGIRVCPIHMAKCIKKSLSKKSNRNVKEEIIYHSLLNTGNVSLVSLCDYLDLEEAGFNQSLLDGLIKKLGNGETDIEENEESDELKASKPPSGLKMKNRGRRLGQGGDKV